MRVYDRLCLQPYTVNFKAFILKLNVLMHLHGNAGLLPECSVSDHSGDGSSLRMHSTLLLVGNSSYGLTINDKLLADRKKLYPVG